MANPVDVIVSGVALNSQGFEGMNFVSAEGLGLNSFGFLWPCEGIWNPSYPEPTTVWTDCAFGATTVENCLD